MSRFRLLKYIAIHISITAVGSQYIPSAILLVYLILIIRTLQLYIYIIQYLHVASVLKYFVLISEVNTVLFNFFCK